jgi:hypothetical protein
MKTALKQTLIEAMDRWTVDEADHPERPENGLISPDLHERMADAAAAVYDAAFSAQSYQTAES